MKQQIFDEDYARIERMWRREKLKQKSEQREADRGQIMSSSLVDRRSEEDSDEEDEQLELMQLEKMDNDPWPSRSIFKVSIQNNQHTLAYLTLGRYENTKAIQDAIESKQFNLIYKILDKIPPHEKLNSVVNKDKQNLSQILFRNLDLRHYSDEEKLKDLMQLFQKRGVDLKVKDASGRQIIHYVCESQNKMLIELLMKFNFDVNERDNQMNTPFFLYFK